jgi:CDP-diacylglycerol--serine O-phosphatidyltransferase
MVSRLPVFSGKTVRMRVPPEMVLPVFVSVVFFVALLIGYPWHILSFGSVLYLMSLPLGWKNYRDHKRNAAAAAAQAAAPTDAAAPPGPAPAFAPAAPDAEQERPARLN